MSDSRIDDFFNVFEKSVQDEILGFCRRLASTHADVYVIMARKAAAFCDCLEELGLLHLDGYVTSDRSLDINGEWLGGKDVIIVDDAVVSGTTLYTTIQKIKSYRAKSISVQILTINEAWYNPSLLQDDAGNSYVFPVYNNLPDNLCIKLCNDLVHAISLVPRPYDIDFPLYKSIYLTEYELHRILVLNDWETYDMRTDLQREHNIINFTLIPNRYELYQLSETFGLDIAKQCIVKIRIHGRLSSESKKRYALRVSSFVIFSEMDIETTQQLFISVVSGHSKVDASQFSGWGSSSQLRFIQFYYSHQLASFWRYRISHLLAEPIELDYTYRNLSLLFPQKYIDDVETLSKRFVKFSPDILPISDADLRPHTAETVYQMLDPVSINARLYEPFLEMYHNKELPCRNLVLEKGKKVFQDNQYEELRNRLNEGLSFQDLIWRLSDCGPYYDIEKKVSLFIDYSIDAGIIVPIIQLVGNTIFRAYRHGEDVLFGRKEEMMYTKMLYLFSKHSGSTGGLSRVSVEKLIVLFSKIGLKEKKLTPYTSNFTAEPMDCNGLPTKILRVKPYMKGAVALVGSALQHQRNKNIPYITNEKKSMWLTYVLIQGGQLCPEDSNLYSVNDLTDEMDISQLTPSELSFVQNFAELAGRISNPSIDTGVSFTDDDWTKISVTLTLPDTITAIAAEMEIFSSEFSIIPLIALTGNDQQDQNEIKYFYNSYAVESISSAVMKIVSFTKKEGQKLIQSVQFPSDIEQRMWLGYFSEELNNHSDDNNVTLKVIFYEQKVWAYLMLGFISTLFILFAERYANRYGPLPISDEQYAEAQQNQTSSFELIEVLESRRPPIAEDAKKMFRLYKSVYPKCFQIPAGDSGIRATIQMIVQAIEQISNIASNIQEIVRDVLGERGKVNDILSFNYVLHINLSMCLEEQRQRACREIERVYRSEQLAIERNRQSFVSKGRPVPNMELRELPQKYKPEPPSGDTAQDMWYIAHGPQSNQRITFLARKIFHHLYRINIDCRITIFERLSYDTSIISNSSEFAEYHCNQFNTFIEPFKNEFLFPDGGCGPGILHICPSHLFNRSRCREAFEEDPRYRAVRSEERKGMDFAKESYRITEYVSAQERKIVMNMSTAFDFGIITILPEEMAAVRQIFSLHRFSSKFGERIYYTGKVGKRETAGMCHIVCTQTVDQGEYSVINAYHDMVDKFRPKFILLIGIAGSILNSQKDETQINDERPELDLCDVVIARSVIDYELRKETEDGVQHRGRIFNVSAQSVAVVNDFLSVLESAPITAVGGSKNAQLHVLFEPIGSGNAVIGSELSKIVTWLKGINSKVAAVEMEAAGISASFYESRLSNNEVQGMLVIRGISDKADVEKQLCKAFRSPAAQNAALVAKKLIESFPEL